MRRLHWMLHLCLLLGGGAALAAPPPVQFVDATDPAGITFRHAFGGSRVRFILETTGPGCAFFDYDGDGYLDVYLVQSGEWERPQKPEYHDALYRNNGDGTFTDVTAAAGLADSRYGMGAFAADYDDDGDADLYLTAYGPNVLYRNNGDGTFTDVTAAARVGERRWSSSAAWADVDRDGDLDLFVCNFVQFTPAIGLCDTAGLQVVCSPRRFAADRNTLYRNDGPDATGQVVFTDVTREAGMAAAQGKSLACLFFDYDADGWPDLYIANDTTRNTLYRNRGDGTFQDVTLRAGVGYSEEGVAESGMGVDAIDINGDGWLDFTLTNFQRETNTLYVNLGNGRFRDVTFRSGVGFATLGFLAFGINFLDYDHDGRPDLFVANGHIDDQIHKYDQASTYAQTNQLFRNQGDGKFADRSAALGPGLAVRKVSRGVAVGDYDNDGDQDLLIANSNDRPTLLRNDGGHRAGHWLSLRLRGTRSPRDPAGARVVVKTGDRLQSRSVSLGSGFCATSDPRLHFGLGSHRTAETITIHWPSGAVQVLKDVAANRFLVVVEPPS